ncbi:hypothetical protein [Pseudofrankia sp. DC12]|uniref:hypothetical protein n=1 Tax=Pseudofrankia sp. DC12 TaxID=683315 RepID=UPI0005F86921|nr:hypothetical protein [Pseudofrankia sp. DC12]
MEDRLPDPARDGLGAGDDVGRDVPAPDQATLGGAELRPADVGGAGVQVALGDTDEEPGEPAAAGEIRPAPVTATTRRSKVNLLIGWLPFLSAVGLG